MIPVALTIAGSDSGGGAGIQADLKTFSALGVYGMSALTSITAQNTREVRSVFEVPAEVLSAQIDAVIEDIRPGAVKTGLLPSKASVEAVAEKLEGHRQTNIVVDPVMVSGSGTTMMAHDAIMALRACLLPLARVITPNLEEAQVLAGRRVETLDDMELAARELQAMGASSVLVKGGHLSGQQAVDVFFDGEDSVHLSLPRQPKQRVHGTGCVLSAAIAAFLASGQSLREAVESSKNFVDQAIRDALDLGGGVEQCDPLGLRRKGDAA